jgi:DNA replication protein DnaC
VVRPSLLIIDEARHLTLDATPASLVFQVIAERDEKEQAVVLTSNKTFAEWARLFVGEPVMASAALYRLCTAPRS